MQHSRSQYAAMQEHEFPGMEEDNVWQPSSESESDTETQEIVHAHLRAKRSQTADTLHGVIPNEGFGSMHAYRPEWLPPLHTTHDTHSGLHAGRKEYLMPEFPEEYNDDLPKYNKNSDHESEVSSTKYNDMPGAKKYLPMTIEEEYNRKTKEDKAWDEFILNRRDEGGSMKQKRDKKQCAKQHMPPAQQGPVEIRPAHQKILQQFCDITGQSQTQANVILSRYNYDLAKALHMFLS